VHTRDSDDFFRKPIGLCDGDDQLYVLSSVDGGEILLRNQKNPMFFEFACLEVGVGKHAVECQ
jgi:hypothetical protein